MAKGVSVEVKGGDKLAATLAALAAKIEKGKALKVGYLEDATYPDGTHVAQVAFWQEYGTTTAPPRPTFRPMIAAKSSGWGAILAKAMKATHDDSRQALTLLGEVITNQLVESVVETTQPELSEVTLILRKMKDDDPTLVVNGSTVAEARRRAARGEKGATGTRAKPLIDTGVMQRGPAYEVVGK